MWPIEVLALFLFDPSRPLIVESFWKNLHLDEYFALSPPNYILGGYVKYIWYVRKKLILLHDLTMFSFILIILHNFKY